MSSANKQIADLLKEAQEAYDELMAKLNEIDQKRAQILKSALKNNDGKKIAHIKNKINKIS